jgi:hypothetical protein
MIPASDRNGLAPKTGGADDIEENDTTFAIGWKGRYRIEGPAFIYVDHDTGQLSTILGYPTHQLK